MIFFQGKSPNWNFWRGCIVGWAVYLQVGGATSLPVPETLHRQILKFYQEVRCPVCAGQSIADSDTAEAIALKHFIYRELSTGKSVDNVRSSLRRTYGEDILFEPPLTSQTLLLWLSPFILFLMICVWGGYKLGKACRRMS